MTNGKPDSLPPPLLWEDGQPPALPEAITACEAATGMGLPADYRRFLNLSNGYNGPLGKGYLVLWGVAELAELATGYDSVLPPGPRQCLLGSNGGPTAYGWCDDGWCAIAFIGGDRRVLATDFAGFLDAITRGEGW